MTQQLGKRTFEADAKALRAQLNLANAQTRAVSGLIGLPALRAAWPMSSVDYAAVSRARDVSGQGYHLGDGGGGANVTFSYDTNSPLAPIAIFGGGANQYLARGDVGVANWADITGGEAYIRAVERGLTLGGWFYWAALPGALQYIMAKQGGGVNQYDLWVWNTNNIVFRVWPGPVQVTSSATINAGWNHCAGIYDQIVQTLYVVLNGVITAGGAGAAPAALADTGAAFAIGADSAGANRFTGYGSMCFLQACSMSEGGTGRGIVALYQQQRELFGV